MHTRRLSTYSYQVLPKIIHLKLPIQTLQSSSTLFPFQKHTSLLDIVHDIKDEHHGLSVQIKKFDSDESLTDKQLDADQLPSLLNGKYSLWIDSKRVILNERELNQNIQAQAEKLVSTESAVKSLDETFSRMLRNVSVKLALTKLSIGAYLVGQLGSVIYLTLTLGWDLMEPVTFMIISGTSIIIFGISLFKKKDYTYMALEDLLRRRWMDRYIKKNQFNMIRYKKAQEELFEQKRLAEQFKEFAQK